MLHFILQQDPFFFAIKIDKYFIKIINGEYIILDQTAFYPRSGGQEPDHGFIGGSEVMDVEKYGNVVLHKVKGKQLAEGQQIRCKINVERRATLARHHTATHLVNGAAQKGTWVVGMAALGLQSTWIKRGWI